MSKQRLIMYWALWGIVFTLVVALAIWTGLSLSVLLFSDQSVYRQP